MKGVIEHFEQLTSAEKLYGLSLFWKEASYNFAFFDQVAELDFNQMYQEFIPKVIAAKSTYEYYRTLQLFCALLQDGHTNIYMPFDVEENNIDWPPISTTELNQEAIVTSIAHDLLESIPLGSKILAVDDVPIKAYLERKVMPYIASSTNHILWAEAVRKLLHGAPNSYLVLTILTPQGERRSKSVGRDARSGRYVEQSLNLPSAQNKLIKYKRFEMDISYIGLNDFSREEVIREFELLLPAVRKSKGLILDLRFNGGGSSLIAAEILSHLTRVPLQGASWKARQHVSVYKAWGVVNNKYKQYAEDNAWITGEHEMIEPKPSALTNLPIYVLIGRDTASAAEDFLVYTQSLDYITTIGEKTYGSTGQPLFHNLPGGGCFRICSKRDCFPDGKEFVGIGIEPNIVVTPKYQHVLNGVDYVLDTAVELMKKNIIGKTNASLNS